LDGRFDETDAEKMDFTATLSGDTWSADATFGSFGSATFEETHVRSRGKHGGVRTAPA
jgi:hypothetical protein